MEAAEDSVHAVVENNRAAEPKHAAKHLRAEAKLFTDNKMKKKWEYIYGPVPSRRLGLSLGVDLVPYKTCNFDCVYCQLGRTREKTTERRNYIKAEDILENLFMAIKEVNRPDFITLAGSGEPTLNSDIRFIIKAIKDKSDLPVAVLTNGSLLSDPEVREALTQADVVLPSLDAGDEETFLRINRPHESLNLKDIIDGLITFRKEFMGAIWLEVFCIEGINTGAEQLENLKKAIEKIAPDKIQLNTAVRPPAESFVQTVEYSRLCEIREAFGEKCEVVAPREKSPEEATNVVDPEMIMAILSRRPCTLLDLSRGLKASPNHILKTISLLQEKGYVKSYFQNRDLFYTRAAD